MWRRWEKKRGICKWKEGVRKYVCEWYPTSNVVSNRVRGAKNSVKMRVWLLGNVLHFLTWPLCCFSHSIVSAVLVTTKWITAYGFFSALEFIIAFIFADVKWFAFSFKGIRTINFCSSDDKSVKGISATPVPIVMLLLNLFLSNTVI